MIKRNSFCAKCIPDADDLPTGYLTETHEVATAFMRSVAAMLLAGQTETGRGGAALWLDYGFPAREYYLDERAQGTLMCHYRHHAHPNPFFLPGLQDITAHVNFTAIAQAGVDMGLTCMCYTSQAAFLLAAGIGDLLLRIPNNEVMRYLPASNAVQKLISPAEMGELFKVLVMGCGLTMPEKYLTFDRSHRL
jgi:SAM-dependent MidA family methyltransferase